MKIGQQGGPASRIKNGTTRGQHWVPQCSLRAHLIAHPPTKDGTYIDKRHNPACSCEPFLRKMFAVEVICPPRRAEKTIPEANTKKK
jgi:hypothetical protein